MNSFLFTIVTFCLAAQCALASYQSAQPSYGYSQRKQAPMPQSYGQQQYGGHQEPAQYEMMSNNNNYGQSSMSYKAPSSAAVSSYDERSSYAKPAASYGSSAHQASGYGAPASGYAKPAAPRYEEPYHPPMPFAWGYDINDGYGGAQYHKETGDEYGKRTGSYGYTDAYGVYRQVDYVADEHGFRATIKTNEPGTANESPADVELHAYEPPSNYYAGNSYSSGNSYGASSAGNSYSAAPAAPAMKSYGNQQASSYGSSSGGYAPARQQSSYQRSSYSAPKQQAAAYSAPRHYEQSAYASGSNPVPVYSKATAATATKTMSASGRH